MPIVRMEMVLREGEQLPDKTGLQALADGLGECLGSPPGGTWLMAVARSSDHYVENGGPVLETLRPVFLTIIRHQLPDPESLGLEARQMSDLAARILDRPVENVHIIFEPPAAGRIAFGGELRV